MKNSKCSIYILNPPEDLEYISTTGDSEIARYVIDVNMGNVKISEFPNNIQSNFINTFDFPTTTVATEFGCKMFRHFSGLHSLLSPPTHVLSFSPHFKDSVEWSNISVD